MNLQRPAYAQRGFTLAELMIAMTLGLMILAGMTTLFVNNTQAQGEIEKANRQVENGRYAIQVLSSDLRNAGFYGELDPTVLATPAAAPDPCLMAVADLKSALPLHVQGYDNAAAATVLSCLGADLRSDTDVLVVRHASTCVAGVGSCDPVSAGGPFFQASLCNNPSELDSGNSADFYALDLGTAGLTRHKRDCSQVAASGTLAAIRRYETHIYFIANNDNPGDGRPTLKRAELRTDAAGVASFPIVPLVEGIENLQLEYGIDTNNDGVTDLYTSTPASANGCTLAACAAANWRNVMSVKLNLLARNLDQSVGYTDTKTYQLGTSAVAAANDHYKRHVFQAVVSLPNPTGRRLQ